MRTCIDLAGRAILVTGAAGGLGRAITLGLAQAGADVVVSDLPSDRLEHVGEVAGQHGVPARLLPADLADSEQAAALVSRAVELGLRLDGLVNCVGDMQTRPMAALTSADWRRSIELNLNSVFDVTRAFANAVVHDDRPGSVVTLASVAARSGRPNAPHYSAAKTALLSLTKSAAMAYAPLVRFNAVCPGIFLTPMWDAIRADRDREFGPGAGDRYLAEVCSRVPLARAGDPGELAHVVAFLLSDLSSYITGQAINVDGGLEMD